MSFWSLTFPQTEKISTYIWTSKDTTFYISAVFPLHVWYHWHRVKIYEKHIALVNYAGVFWTIFFSYIALFHCMIYFVSVIYDQRNSVEYLLPAMFLRCLQYAWSSGGQRLRIRLGLNFILWGNKINYDCVLDRVCTISSQTVSHSLSPLSCNFIS